MPPEHIVVDGIPYVLSRAVAKTAGLSPNYISRFCREELVQAVRNNGLWYVNEDSLRNYLADQARQRDEWNQKQSELRKQERGLAEKSAAPTPTRSALPATTRRVQPAEALLAGLTLFAVMASGALAYSNIAPEAFARSIDRAQTGLAPVSWRGEVLGSGYLV